jgi:hypothetical protein
MAVVTRRIPALVNTTSELAADEVDEEAGIPYFCSAQHRHIHHSDGAD